LFLFFSSVSLELGAQTERPKGKKRSNKPRLKQILWWHPTYLSYNSQLPRVQGCSLSWKSPLTTVKRKNSSQQTMVEVDTVYSLQFHHDAH
jgi:hypothetical protein